MGFYQIKLAESCKDKTAFTSGYHHYRFTRTPLGLRSSSHTFNKCLTLALSHLIGKILFIYVDDIVVMSDSIPEHINRLKIVFETLRHHNLKLSPSKCNFLRTKLSFLGYIISQDGIEPDETKLAPIMNFPTPKTTKDIKSFLGMVGYYRRHIPKMSEKAKPLYDLLKSDVKFKWSVDCENAMNFFKKCLTTPPILQYPNFLNKFYIICDGSRVAISGILCQGTPGNLLPISYASRTLIDAETRYASFEIEVLAIVWSVRHYTPYIYGTTFEIFSDCQALQWLMNLKSPNSRLLRWKFELTGYDFKITHIKGKDNIIADCLSRYVPESKEIKVITRAQARDAQAKSSFVTAQQALDQTKRDKESPIEVSTIPTIIESSDDKLIVEFPTQLFITNVNDSLFIKDKKLDIEQVKPWKIYHKSKEIIIWTDGLSLTESHMRKVMMKLDTILHNIKVTKLFFSRKTFKGSTQDFEVIKKAISNQFEGKNIHFLFLTNKITILTDPVEIQQILKDFHDSPLAGHQGVRRMAQKISQQYKWIGLHKDVQTFVRNCKTCQLSKPRGLSKQPMQITSNSRTIFSTIHIDCVGPLPDSTQGFKYIFTFMDELSRYFGATPMIDHTADTVARTLVESVILRFGIPEIIFSDLGSENVNELTSKAFKLLGIKHHKTSPYHPQSNGMLERSHSTLKAILRANTKEIVSTWPTFVPYAVFVINSSINRTTNYSPHELVFGYRLLLPSNLKKKPDPVYNYDDYLSELKFKMQIAHQLARDEILKSKLVNKSFYDDNPKPLKLKVGDKVLITNEDRKTKMHNPFIGPFEITKVVSDVNIEIMRNRKRSIIHLNRVKKYHNDSDVTVRQATTN